MSRRSPVSEYESWAGLQLGRAGESDVSQRLPPQSAETFEVQINSRLAQRN